MSTVEALVPIFLMIVGGRVLGALAFPAPDFWERASTLAYWVLLPSLLLRATAKSNVLGSNALTLALVVIIPILSVFGLLALLRRLTSLTFPLDPAFVQSCVRQNSYVALAASLVLWGEQALAALALVLAIYVPFVNTASTWLLAQDQTTDRTGQRKRSRQLLRIVTNPLVLACLAGIGLARFDVALPTVVDASLDIAGRAALPLALLAIGASLRVDVLRARAGWLVLASTVKLAVFPLITWSLAATLGLGSIDLAVVVLVAAMPTAASAYPLTREMGGDADFVASAITLQTLAATVSVPIVVLLIDAAIGGMPG